MKYDKISAYDKSKDKTIDMCLNCTKKKCTGDCNVKNMKHESKGKGVNK